MTGRISGALRSSAGINISDGPPQRDDLKETTVGPAGVQGPAGPAGPPGPQGVQGPAGSSTDQRTLHWRGATAETDPGHGYAGADNDVVASILNLYLSVFDVSDQIIMRLVTLKTDETIVVYEPGQIDARAHFTVSGTPVNHADQWFTVPVTLALDVGFTPMLLQQVFVALGV